MTYADAIKAPARELTTRGSVTPAGGALIPLTDQHIISWSVDEGDGDFPLGSVSSNRFTLRLANAQGEWLEGGSIRGEAVLIGATVKVEFGIMVDGAFEYTDIGTFTVEKAAYSEGDSAIVLTGSDALLVGLTKKLDDTQLYPRTIQQLFDFLLTEGEITLDPAFSTLPVNGSASITRRPRWGQGINIRQALAYVCAATGSFFRVGRNGLFQIVPAYSPTPKATLDPTAYMKLTDDEKTFTFNRMKVFFSEEDTLSVAVNEATEEKANNTLAIDSNPLFFKYRTTTFVLTTDTEIKPGKTYYVRLANGLYKAEENPEATSLYRYFVKVTSGEHTETAAALLNGMKTLFTGMGLRGMNIRWRGDPKVGISDRITLTDTRGRVFTTTIQQQTLTFDKGFHAVVSCVLQDAEALGSAAPPPALPGLEVDGSAEVTLVADGSLELAKFSTNAMSALKLLAYPVGAVYVSVQNTPPGTLFGGTWVLITDEFYVGNTACFAWRRTA